MTTKVEAAALVDQAADSQETAVEHLQNARQMLVWMLDAAKADPGVDGASYLKLSDQVEAANKRILKALVKLKQATAALTP